MKLHLKEQRPLLYLSGTGSGGTKSSELELINMGCKYRCFSYAYTCPDAFYYTKKMAEALAICVKNKIGIMMDSAAHSFHVLAIKGHRKVKGKWRVNDVDKLKKMVIKQYVDYVKKEGKNWDFCVTFDYIRDCPTIYDMQKLLEDKGIKPIPVYHGDHGVEWLQRYCEEGYKLIGIGTALGRLAYKDRRYYYDQVFNVTEKYGVLTHGFAMTGLSLMYMYPWYSVDSATWAKVAAYGSIIYINLDRQIIGEIHLTDKLVGGKTRYNSLPKGLQKQIAEWVEDAGFNIDTLRKDGRARSLYNVWVYCNKIYQYKDIVMDTRKKWRSLLA